VRPTVAVIVAWTEISPPDVVIGNVTELEPDGIYAFWPTIADALLDFRIAPTPPRIPGVAFKVMVPVAGNPPTKVAGETLSCKI
jgi:hypothetical protein